MSITKLSPHLVDLSLSSSKITDFSVSYDLGHIDYIKDPSFSHIIEAGIKTFLYDFFSAEFQYGIIFAVQQSMNKIFYTYTRNCYSGQKAIEEEDQEKIFNFLNIKGIDDVVISVLQTESIAKETRSKIEDTVDNIDLDLVDSQVLSSYCEQYLSGIYQNIKDLPLAAQYKQIVDLGWSPIVEFENIYCDQFDRRHDDVGYKNSTFRSKFIYQSEYSLSDDVWESSDRKKIYDKIDAFNGQVKDRLMKIDWDEIATTKDLGLFESDYSKKTAFSTNALDDDLNSSSKISSKIIYLEALKKQSKVFRIFHQCYSEIVPYFEGLLENIANSYIDALNSSSSEEIVDQLIDFFNILKKHSSLEESEYLGITDFIKKSIVADAKKYLKSQYVFVYMLTIFAILLENRNILKLLILSTRYFPTALDKDKLIKNIQTSFTTSVATSSKDNRLIKRVFNNNKYGIVNLYYPCQCEDLDLEALNLSRYDAFSHYFTDQPRQYSLYYAAPSEKMFYSVYRKYDYQVSGVYNLEEIYHLISGNPYEPAGDAGSELSNRFIYFGCNDKIATRIYDYLPRAITTIRDSYNALIGSIGNGPYAKKTIGFVRDVVCGRLSTDVFQNDELASISCYAISNTCDDTQYIVNCDGYYLISDDQSSVEQRFKCSVVSSAYAVLSSLDFLSVDLTCNALSDKCDPDPTPEPDLCALALAAYGSLDRKIESNKLKTLERNTFFDQEESEIVFMNKRYFDIMINNDKNVKSYDYPCLPLWKYYGYQDIQTFMKSQKEKSYFIRVPVDNKVYVLIINQMHFPKNPKLDAAMAHNPKIIADFTETLEFLYKDTSHQLVLDQFDNLTREQTIQKMKKSSIQKNVIVFILSHGGGGKYDATLDAGFKSECFACSDTKVVYDSEISSIYQNTENTVFINDACYSGGTFNPKNEYKCLYPTGDTVADRKSTSKNARNFIMVYSDAPGSSAWGVASDNIAYDGLMTTMPIFVFNKNLTYDQIANNFNTYMNQARKLIGKTYVEFMKLFQQFYLKNPFMVHQYIREIIDADMRSGSLKDLEDENYLGAMLQNKYKYTISTPSYGTLEYQFFDKRYGCVTDNSKIEEIKPASGVSLAYGYIIDQPNISFKKIYSEIEDYSDMSDSCINRILRKIYTSKTKILSFVDGIKLYSKFSSPTAYLNHGYKYPLLSDTQFATVPAVDRSTLRLLALKCNIKIVMIIVNLYMKMIERYTPQILIGKKPSIIQYNGNTKCLHYEDSSSIFEDLHLLVTNYITDDYPGIMQCRGNASFMDQPFLRFTV